MGICKNKGKAGAYRVSPHASTGDHVTASRVPRNVGHTVVLNGLHQLNVGSEILLGLNLLTLEVHIPEVQVEAGLGVDSGDNHETSLRRPVDTVAGLLLDTPHKFEVAGGAALFLRSEERDRSLRGNGDAGGGLAISDNDETGSIGLPSKVDDSVLKTVNNLNGNTLLAHAENLEVGGHGLLGLGVTVDLDTDVGTLGLPVQLHIGDIEQVTGTDNLLGRNTHHSHTSGVAANLGGPEAEELLVLLDTLTADSGGRPLEIAHTFNLDRCTAEQVHVGQLVDGDRLTLEHAGDVLLVRGPLESGPLDLLLGGNITLVDGLGRQIVRNE